MGEDHRLLLSPGTASAGALMHVHMCGRPQGEGQLCHDPSILLRGEDDTENYL